MKRALIRLESHSNLPEEQGEQKSKSVLPVNSRATALQASERRPAKRVTRAAQRSQSREKDWTGVRIQADNLYIAHKESVMQIERDHRACWCTPRKAANTDHRQ